ncbi:unnamed protein product [Sphenostylis stenocarpa]|uniref:Uncharacterized protein n=1 Tax=Sphenostylis stenocarpa TaxID=92480 RepID=A0AA86SCK7_9FABA|nr:unnamed protein product [Sphenostylis stenocarpa]
MEKSRTSVLDGYDVLDGAVSHALPSFLLYLMGPFSGAGTLQSRKFSEAHMASFD